MRELRLIAAHKPRYNRRSRHPEKVHWLKLTVEPWPRLSLVRKVAEDGADYLGPFASRRTAEKCLTALHEAFPIRQCSDRLAITPTRSPCVLAEMGRCLSPCDGSVEMDHYAALVATVRENLLERADEVVDALTARMDRLASDERFEEAGVHRERLSAFLRAASRTQRLGSLSSCAELVAARREADHRWAVHVVRHGRLAAAGVIPSDAHAGVWVTALRESAETVADGPGPDPGRERRGVGADPALARAARRPPRPRRRGVDLPHPRRHSPPRVARCGRGLAHLTGPVRRTASAGHGGPALTAAR